MPLYDRAMEKNEMSLPFIQSFSKNLIYLYSIFSYIFKTNEMEGALKNNVEMLVEIAGLNDLEEKAQNLEEGTVIQN